MGYYCPGVGTFAQASAGLRSIYDRQPRGIVSDSTGAAVSGANVAVVNVDTNLTRTATSGQDGSYLFPLLPIGTYQLSVGKVGFSEYKQVGIKLAVNQVATPSVTLQVGTVQQGVNVSVDAQILPTETATVSDLVDQKRIVDTPLDGRQAQTLLFLVPGTSDTTSKWCGFNCQGGVYPGAQFGAVNGSGPGNVNYRDRTGQTTTTTTSIQTIRSQPGRDSGVQRADRQHVCRIRELRSGGQCSDQIRHESVPWQCFRVPAQRRPECPEFLCAGAGHTQTEPVRSDFGGRIIKNKLFFFGTYQGTRITTAASGNIAFVPTAAERTGDFSALTTQIYDPTSHAPFPGNQIPTNLLSAPSLFFLKYIPLPNGPNGQLTFLGPTAVQHDDQFMPKIDYLRGKHQISGPLFLHQLHAVGRSIAGSNEHPRAGHKRRRGSCADVGSERHLHCLCVVAVQHLVRL